VDELSSVNAPTLVNGNDQAREDKLPGVRLNELTGMYESENQGSTRWVKIIIPH
jgi:hypothetical protein